MPCGACRQWFVELAPDADIIVDGIKPTFTVGELLPVPFTLKPRTAKRKPINRRKAK
jgi:cytidine deaminase